jgi:hypothetical protein
MVTGLKKVMFRIKWLTMSPRQRYSYLWARGGSLRHSSSGG